MRKKPAARKRKAPSPPRAEKARVGRPSKRTPAIVERICARLSLGEPLAQICRDADMPDVSTVWDWSKDDPGISQSIARARELGFDALAAEALRIADTPIAGVRTKAGKDGVEEWTEDMLGHRRLQVETRLKLLAKWDPARYGDALRHSNDPNNPMPAPVQAYVMVPPKVPTGDGET
jgi:hypothetical protein